MIRENRVAELEKQMEAMRVETVPIDNLKPNDYNPNRQTPDEFEKLKRSILENGFGVESLASKRLRSSTLMQMLSNRGLVTQKCRRSWQPFSSMKLVEMKIWSSFPRCSRTLKRWACWTWFKTSY